MPVEQSATDISAQHFTGYLADTRESRRIHYRIRYQVYCERKGFEDNAVLRKRGLERDAFDGHALPFIMRDEREGHWRGTARLVIRGNAGLPVEGTGALPAGFCDQYAPGSLGEVSRLAALTPRTEPRGDRWAMLKATLGTVLTCADTFRLEHVLFLITPALARVVQRIGIPMVQAGEPIEHRGERRVYLSRVALALDALEAAGVTPQFEHYSAVQETGAALLA